MSLFENSTRLKLRFESPQGLLCTEDLWDLPLTSKNKNKANLNDVARVIAKDINIVAEEDFVGEVSNEDEMLTLKLDVVKQIIKHKKLVNAKAKLALDNKAKRAKLLDALAKKQDETISQKTEAELLAELEALG